MILGTPDVIANNVFAGPQWHPIYWWHQVCKGNEEQWQTIGIPDSIYTASDKAVSDWTQITTDPDKEGIERC